MEINQYAVLKAQKSIEIMAPADTVFNLLAEISSWPQWQPDVTSAELPDGLAVGHVFHWKAAGLNITSKIQELELNSRIGWTGKSLGMQAVHRWRLEVIERGTQVTTEESLNGWFAQLLKLFDPHFLEKSLVNSLKVLKNQAEQK